MSKSHRDYLRSGYPASSSACHGLLIITVITPLPAKASATKMPNWLSERALLACRCVSVMLLRSMQKYEKELADAKAENDALRDDDALVVVGCTSKRSVSRCVKPPPPPAWIMQPPDWQTPLNPGIISPSERGWSLCKNNWKEPKYINERCR